jgi:hypothetical protein
MCKGLASPVPQGMIKKAYEKHRKTLSSVGESPREFLDDFKEVLRFFGEELKKENFSNTRTPGRSGYLGHKRSEGGLFEALKDQFRPKGFRQRIIERRDPVVVHVEGPPGIGKSLIINEVSRQIAESFGFRGDRSSYMYNRSVLCDHWDGYKNQLIASIDDFGCINERQQDDMGALIQICSDQDYVLPMADLREKGTKFNSNFLFISTNGAISHHQIYGYQKMAQPSAVLRRLSPTYTLTRNRVDNKWLYTCVKHVWNQETEPEVVNSFPRSMEQSFGSRMPRFTQVDYCQGTYQEIAKFLTQQTLLDFDSRNGKIFQPVIDGEFGNLGYGYYFPSKPPARFPECEAHAIAEPLKVRLITKNEPNTWVLKPVQMALWRTLKKFPVFDLTNSPDIDLERLLNRGKYLVSGDYEAATDNFHLDIMATAVDTLSHYIPKSLVDWFKWEGGQHKIHYPSWTGLDSILQTRGQLMGSLLSFPILCLANFTTWARAWARVTGNKDITYWLKEGNKPPLFINGDDILFPVTGLKDPLYHCWRAEATSIGLKPSVGKCYVSRQFGLINSQMILSYTAEKFLPVIRKGEIKQEYKIKPPWKHLRNVAKVVQSQQGLTSQSLCSNHSLVQILQGKIKSYVHKSSRDFELALTILPPKLVVQLNKHILEQTPESIDLSKDFGGIGLNKEGYKPTLLDKEVYAFKVFRHEPVILDKIDQDSFLVRVPKILDKPSFKKGFPIPDEPSEQSDEFPWKDFRKFCSWYKKVPNLRDRIRGLELLESPPLSLWTSDLRWVNRKEFLNMRTIADNMFDWSKLTLYKRGVDQSSIRDLVLKDYVRKVKRVG